MDFEEWRRRKEQEMNRERVETPPMTPAEFLAHKIATKKPGYSHWNSAAVSHGIAKNRAKARTDYNLAHPLSERARPDGEIGYRKWEAARKPKEEPKKDFKSIFFNALAGAGNAGHAGQAALGGAVKDMMEDTAYKEPNDEWAGYQKLRFGELYNTDPEKAAEYAIAVNNDINRKKKDKQRQIVADKATSGVMSGAAHTAASISAGMIGAADTAEHALETLIRGQATEHGYLSPAEYARTVQGSIASNLNDKYGTIDEKVPVFGGRGVGDIYGLGTSVATAATHALAAMATGGASQIGSDLANFGQASSAAIEDAKNRGATDEQALALGVLSGLIEAATERYSIGSLLKMSSGRGIKVALNNLAKQMFTEGSEEAVSDILDLYADGIVMGDKSKLQESYRGYKAKGIPPKDAMKMAYKDFAGDVAFDFLGGAASGGLLGAGNMMIQNQIQQNNENQVSQPVEAPETVEVPETVETPRAEQQIPYAEPTNVEPVRVEESVDTVENIQGPKPQMETRVPSGESKRSGVTYTAGNKPIKFKYAIVPAESLVASNDSYGGKNPHYPAELQPRDRTRASSRMWVSTTSKSLNPALLADSPTAQNGAPIVRNDGVVIGGNGRVAAINAAYKNGTANDYREYITSRAEEFGIDPAAVPDNPVLIRIPDGEYDAVKLAQDLNASTTHSYSETERAQDDAVSVGEIIGYLNISSDGTITDANNHDFIQNFVESVPASERGDMVQSDGRLSQSGERRIKNAVFSFAYGDPELTKRLTESTDNNVKNITNAMLFNAPGMAKLQSAIENGEVQQFGLREAVVGAANLYLDAKESSQKVEDAASQMEFGSGDLTTRYDGLTVNLANFLEANSRSGKAISGFYSDLINGNLAALSADAEQSNMFATTEKLTQEEVYDRARENYETERGGKNLPDKLPFGDYREFVGREVESTGREGTPGKAEMDAESTGGLSEEQRADLFSRYAGDAELEKLREKHRADGTYHSTSAAFSPQAPVREAIETYGAIPQGENPVRTDTMPKSITGKDKVSRVARTVMGAEVTPASFTIPLSNDVADLGMSYIPITNDAVTKQAEQEIIRDGWEESLTKWKVDVHNRKATAKTVAKGALLLNNAAKARDKALWLDILHDMQSVATNAGQAVQAFRIIKQLEPSDKLYMIRRSVKQMVDDLGLDNDIKIPDELATRYQEETDPKKADKILDEIAADVASQVPPTFVDKWNALRYMNMLGNLKTQVRNISGNVAMGAAYKVEDKIAAIAEKMIPKDQRTKSVTVNRNLLKQAAEDYTEFRDIIADGGKYNDTASNGLMGRIKEKQTIFDGKYTGKAIGKTLEAYRKATNWAMNNEKFGDAAFGKQAYARALAGFLQARGFKDINQVSPETMDRARAYAIQRAQEQTFHDNNMLSSAVSKMGRRRDTTPWGRVVSEGIMPFRKTPANVLVRAEEFSPLGLINTLYKAAQAQKGTASATEVIESLSKTLTGTALVLLGAWMGNAGMISGGPDADRDREEFDRMTGKQNYALNLPNGTTMTIDFLSPTTIPVFMGAQLGKAFSETGMRWQDIQKALVSISDPMIKMSMLQGIDDAISGVRFADSGAIQTVLNAATSYLTQGISNTLLGQLERSSEGKRMTTYIDKDGQMTADEQRQLGKLSAKTPGWDFQQMPYLNAWGEEEEHPKGAKGAAYQLLSPSYVDHRSTDPVDKEIARLDDVDSTYGVIPKKAPTSCTSGGKDYHLTASEWSKLQRKQGQTAHKLLSEAIKTKTYKSMTDDDKEKVFELVYDYAREVARREAVPGYKKAAGELGGRLRYLDNALKSRMKMDTFLDVYADYKKINDSDAENGDKARQWAVKLDEARERGAISESQREMLKADMRIWSNTPVEPGKYDQMVSSGLSSSAANIIATAISNLTPMEGHSTVRDSQKWDAITDSNLTAREVDNALRAYMSDSQYEKYESAKRLGISAEEYVDAYIAQSDESKKDPKLAALRTVVGSDAERLYEILYPRRKR